MRDKFLFLFFPETRMHQSRERSNLEEKDAPNSGTVREKEKKEHFCKEEASCREFLVDRKIHSPFSLCFFV
jgi:hypothetical protein